jgi:hypothetical protein
MLEHGFIPLYFENKDIVHSPHLVMQKLKFTVKTMRILLNW